MHLRGSSSGVHEGRCRDVKRRKKALTLAKAFDKILEKQSDYVVFHLVKAKPDCPCEWCVLQRAAHPEKTAHKDKTLEMLHELKIALHCLLPLKLENRTKYDNDLMKRATSLLRKAGFYRYAAEGLLYPKKVEQKSCKHRRLGISANGITMVCEKCKLPYSKAFS